MDYEEILKEQMKNVVEQDEIDSLSGYASQLSDGISDNFTMDKIVDATLSGESIFDSAEVISDLKSLFLYEIRSALVVGVEIMAICIIVGLLKNLSGSFSKKGVSDIAMLTCSIVIIGLAMTNFNTVYQLTVDSVKTITYTMEILLPVLIAVLISMGRVASGTIMSPLLLTAITIFQTIIKNVIMPAIFVSTVFTLINCLTEKDYVNQIAKFIRRAALAATGILMTIMSGIIAIQGLIVKTSDSLLLDTAKYSIDEFIPIVGGFTADTIELFIKCMGSIKNIIGIFGILIIIVLILTPIIKIGAVALIYKVTAMVISPIATKKLAEGINDIGSCLVSMGAVLFFSSLMFIIFITSIINMGGGG